MRYCHRLYDPCVYAMCGTQGTYNQVRRRIALFATAVCKHCAVLTEAMSQPVLAEGGREEESESESESESEEEEEESGEPEGEREKEKEARRSVERRGSAFRGRDSPPPEYLN